MRQLPEELKEHVTRGQEQPYLEYKADVSWQDRKKKLEIVQTIFALANEKDGGIIVIGIEDNGTICGLSELNLQSYSHDHLNRFLSGKGNQPIDCKLESFEYVVGEIVKKIVVIQVSETKEYPVIYMGDTEKINVEAVAESRNIGLRHGTLYIRNKEDMGNKEIEKTHEWQEIIERTIKKYHAETIRRQAVIGESEDPYKDELTI